MPRLVAPSQDLRDAFSSMAQDWRAHDRARQHLTRMRHVAFGLVALQLASCASQHTEPTLPEAWRSRAAQAKKAPPKPVKTDEGPPPVLTVAYWAWLGERLSVTIHDQGESYLLIGRRLKGPSETWSRQVAKSDGMARLLSILDPPGLAERDPCLRPRRDGVAWLVRREVDGHIVIRDRDADGTLHLEECRTFDAACRELLGLASIDCTTTTQCVRALPPP